MSDWKSVKKDGYPPEKEWVIITAIDRDGDRYTQTGCRYIRDLEEENYTDEYISKHPNGVWEWAYEAGADYWEDIENEVIAWMLEPEPYEGD